MFFVWEPTIGDPVDEVVVWFNGGIHASNLIDLPREAKYSLQVLAVPRLKHFYKRTAGVISRIF
jgi:hypothetical protein